MKRFCIILSFSLVFLISFSCSRKSEIAAANTIATDSKSIQVVKIQVNSPVFSITETKTFRELGLLNPETQSKYLKLSLNDFKEVSFFWSPFWSPEALLDESVIHFVEFIQRVAQAAESALEVYPSEEQALKNWKDSKEEIYRQMYNNIMLLRRIMKAWGL